MGLYLAGRVVRQEKDHTVLEYASKDLFKGLDQKMFCPPERPIIQLNTTTAKLFGRLKISKIIPRDEMSVKLNNGDLFRLYKECSRVIATWKPDMEDDDQRIMWIHVNWLAAFLDVCLENQLIVTVE